MWSNSIGIFCPSHSLNPQFSHLLGSLIPNFINALLTYPVFLVSQILKICSGLFNTLSLDQALTSSRCFVLLLPEQCPLWALMLNTFTNSFSHKGHMLEVFFLSSKGKKTLLLFDKPSSCHSLQNLLWLFKPPVFLKIFSHPGHLDTTIFLFGGTSGSRTHTHLILSQDAMPVCVLSLITYLVGMTGFEPATSSSQS